MTSKEALNNIKKLFIGSPINPTQQFEIIEKDLEMLEIIKRKLIIATNFVSFIAYDNEEYKKIMELIINDINKNKSSNS